MASLLLFFLLLVVFVILFAIRFHSSGWNSQSIAGYLGGAIAHIQNHSKTDIQKQAQIPILNVFLDERNFYHSTKNDGSQIDMLNRLKHAIQAQFPMHNILMHVITKNSNKTDYIDEFEKYEDRYDIDDVLYVANTTYDTEKISKEAKTHHLRGRDDFLTILLTLEHIDKGEKSIIISNDNYKDVDQMFEMPAFNMIRVYKNGIEKRHINPSKYKYSTRFKKIVTNPDIKFTISEFFNPRHLSV